MTKFNYNTVDFSSIEAVEIASGEVSQKNHRGSGGDDLTKEQKRKKALVDYLSDDFDRFHELLDDLIACHHSFGRRREFVSDTLGVPDYVKCENCSKLGESTDGEPICLGTGEEKDGETLYKVIRDTGSVPSFCSRDIRYHHFPEDRLEEVDDDLLSIAEEGYEEYVQDQQETYKERREQAIEEGREHSRYVTKNMSDLVTPREEYVSYELNKLVRGLFDPRDDADFKKSALQVSWLLHLDDVLQEDYYPQRAEAYLRAMESAHQKEMLPGEGGDQFEESVREFVEDLGWPLRDRVFCISGDSRVKRKEMDIHTEIAADPTIIEVYTSGAHNTKEQQVSDYRRLYQTATGTVPRTLHLTDAASHCRISKAFLDTLLQYSPVEVTTAPGDYWTFDTEPRKRSPEPREEARGFEYDFGEVSYSPPGECIGIEKWVEEQLEACSLNVTKPYSELGHWTFAIGPTVTIETPEYDQTLAFHGGRPEDPVELEDSSQLRKKVIHPGRWPAWLAGATDSERVTAIEVAEDAEVQNILTPRLLLTLLQLNPEEDSK